MSILVPGEREVGLTCAYQVVYEPIYDTNYNISFVVIDEDDDNYEDDDDGFSNYDEQDESYYAES